MANTYTQIFIHAVFAVSNRKALIGPEVQDVFHQYIAGTLQQQGAFVYAVGGWLDHVHILFDQPKTKTLSDIMRETKSASSKFNNEQRWSMDNFSWQKGYSAFSCSQKHRDRAIKYIMQQEEHHKNKSFREEYSEWIQSAGIETDERYLYSFD